MQDYTLDAALEIENGSLFVQGLAPYASEINGTLRLGDGVVTGEDLRGIVLDGPVTARVTPANRPGYRSRIELEGEVTAAATVDAFELPLANLVAGQARWRASVLLPSGAGSFARPALPAIAAAGTGSAGSPAETDDPGAAPARRGTEAADSEAAAPLRVSVSSNLSGLALHLPAPFSKQAGEPTNLQLDLAFGADGLDV